jgi:hypothetical protein
MIRPDLFKRTALRPALMARLLNGGRRESTIAFAAHGQRADYPPSPCDHGDEIFCERGLEQSGNIVYIEPAYDRLTVAANGFYRQPQRMRDLFAALALGNHP